MAKKFKSLVVQIKHQLEIESNKLENQEWKKRVSDSWKTRHHPLLNREKLENVLTHEKKWGKSLLVTREEPLREEDLLLCNVCFKQV